MVTSYESQQEFLMDYPFLLKTGEYQFIGCFEGGFSIHLELPAFPKLNEMGIIVSYNEKQIDIDYQPQDTLHDMMENVMKQCSKHKTRVTKVNISSMNMISLTMDQLDLIQNEQNCKIWSDCNFSRIKFSHFKSNDANFIELFRSNGADYKVISHSLPELGTLGEVFKRHASLSVHCASFVQILEQLEEFYSNLHTLDELCFVVSPSRIDTRTNWRIIKYNKKVFLKITIHPLQPSSVIVAFIGPTHEIEDLRKKYDSKLEDWDQSTNVYTNLLRIFEIMSFPMRYAQTDEHDICGICMTSKDDSEVIPLISCDNDKCMLIFHFSCLKQWFSSLKDSRTFFAISIGKCPYCKQKVSSSFDELIDHQCRERPDIHTKIAVFF
ncbi:uncharacterized protein LOC129748960 [Uranotaenia lowii]|uniref:uncharacterized protein LOC129748960 n=1 Tax=Uranotaenia lowii TaxID=190385 RepID=UPI00247A26EF|nr:uncharacterized protein LOC129748960 [Uranotaenia lowii]